MCSPSVAGRTLEGVVLSSENYRAIGCSECGTRPTNSNFRSLITGRPEGVQRQARMPVYRLANDILPAIRSWSSAENDRVNIACHSILTALFSPIITRLFDTSIVVIRTFLRIFIHIYISNIKLKKVETFLHQGERGDSFF